MDRLEQIEKVQISKDAIAARRRLKKILETAWHNGYYTASASGMSADQAREVAWQAREVLRLRLAENDITIDRLGQS